MNSGKNLVGVYTGADIACVLMHGTCWVTWVCDASLTKTGGMSDGCRSLEHWGTWMHEGRQQRQGANVRTWELLEQVTDAGEGLLGCRDVWG